MKTQNLFFTCFFCVLTFTLTAQWQWQNPLPQGNTVNAIHFVDANNGWATGGNTIIHTSDGGINWEVQVLGIEYDISLREICFTDLMNGWVVGGQTPVILQTIDGGNTWFQPPLDFGKLPGSLTDICFVDDLTGWIVGWSAVFQGEVLLSHTSDGGDTWNNQNIDTILPLWSYKISFINRQKGWLAAGKAILHTYDGGNSWNPQYSSQEYIMDIQFIDADHGWAVGEGGTLLLTLNGGESWELSSDPLLSEIKFNEVTFSDPNTGWVCGNYYDDDVFGTILKTTDGGHNWEPELATPEIYPLYCITWLDGLGGFACGSNGEMLKTDVGGTEWEIITNRITTCDFRDVFFMDELYGWAAGGINANDINSPAIFHTQDAGETWTAQQLPLTDNSYILKLFFADLLHGWAIVRGDFAGGSHQLIGTTDGGQNWEILSSEDVGRDLYFIDPEVGWRIGNNGTIQKTQDGGWTWLDQVSGTDKELTAITFISRHEGWIAGEEIILHTTDGGESWDEQPSGGVFHWSDIYFTDQYHGWVSGLVYGLFGSYVGKIMKTFDGGNTWEEVFYFGFSEIVFTDMQNGWGLGPVGSGGGASSPPVNNLWKTSDGGNTWEKQFLPCLIHGGICFTDTNHGWAVGNNGTILHTDNGGTTSFETSPVLSAEICMGAYPNPFQNRTTIHLTLPDASFVNLEIHDITGRKIQILHSGFLQAGEQSFVWDGRGLSEGLYLLRLYAEGITESRKLLLLQ